MDECDDKSLQKLSKSICQWCCHRLRHNFFFMKLKCYHEKVKKKKKPSHNRFETDIVRRYPEKRHYLQRCGNIWSWKVKPIKAPKLHFLNWPLEAVCKRQPFGQHLLDDAKSVLVSYISSPWQVTSTCAALCCSGLEPFTSGRKAQNVLFLIFAIRKWFLSSFWLLKLSVAVCNQSAENHRDVLWRGNAPIFFLMNVQRGGGENKDNAVSGEKLKWRKNTQPWCYATAY